MRRCVCAVLVLLFLALVWETSRKPLWKGGPSYVSHCKFQMTIFGQGIDQFVFAAGRLPRSLAELTETTSVPGSPFFERIPPDPWGVEYDYRVLEGDAYRIRSCGEDGQPDTDDDLVYPDPEDD